MKFPPKCLFFSFYRKTCFLSTKQINLLGIEELRLFLDNILFNEKNYAGRKRRITMVRNKNQEEAFHSGEVFHLWDYLYHTKNLLITMQVLINHTGDEDLKNYAEDVTDSCLAEEAQQIEGVLKEAGIRIPPSPPDRPNVEVEEIPAGARFNDGEIAYLIRKTLMMQRTASSQAAGIALNEEIREMFTDFHGLQEEYEQKLIKLSREKGWLVLPPVNIM
jgi:hypothetical protein